MSKEKLEKKIKTRLARRIDNGMIEEIEGLRRNGLSWKRMEDLGLEYRYITYYLQNKISKEEMIEKLEAEIRHYAKRQMTWFKRNPHTIWLKNGKGAALIVKRFLMK